MRGIRFPVLFLTYTTYVISNLATSSRISSMAGIILLNKG